MFDIGAAELLLVAIVALVVIGPKELPAAMRGVGRVLGQIRSVAGQFSFSLDAMIREAEMEDHEKEWAQKNADIMAKHPPSDEGASDAAPVGVDRQATARDNSKPAPQSDGGGKVDHSNAKPTPMDGEMKPLKSVADDDGEMSSINDTDFDQPDPKEPDSASKPPDDRQDDLFGDKT